MAVMKDLVQVNADLQEQKERAETVDFKMITFSLAGKDYGVDIMNVKEIAKADKFTYVPNAASFIRGVYNLRGDIIPIIDLRIFFHLPQEQKADGQENMLILRINEQVYGTIVDKIDKVVGINHEHIQPPHPIFGDINIKFISGVVEKQGDLYIILDVVRIFGINEENKGKERSGISDTGSFFVPPPVAVEQEQPQVQTAASNTALGFIKEALLALRFFNASPVNEKWLNKRFAEWSERRTESDLQLKGASDADEFLKTFYSPFSGVFWDDNYAESVAGILPKFTSGVIHVWNAGCGKGYETFSIACILKNQFPDKVIKIWANDSDIMAISQAPNVVFDIDEIPEYCRKYMVKGNNGYSFNSSIKDAIVFEYHDVMNENTLPNIDIVLVRDLLSFFLDQAQNKFIDSISEKVKKGGLVILGKNEELTGTGWTSVSNETISAFLHNA